MFAAQGSFPRAQIAGDVTDEASKDQPAAVMGSPFFGGKVIVDTTDDAYRIAAAMTVHKFPLARKGFNSGTGSIIDSPILTPEPLLIVSSPGFGSVSMPSRPFFSSQVFCMPS